jgi:hypothetical protein
MHVTHTILRTLLSTISVGAALSLDYNARGGEVVPVIIAREYI